MQARAVVGICQHLMRQFPPYKVRLPTVAQLIYAFQFLQLVHSTVFQQLTDERVSFFAIDPCTRFLPWTAAGNPPLPAVLQVSRNGYDFCCEALHFKHQWNFKNVRVLLLVED
jgi:hypothetical protein